jgi:hypothetical protein
MTRTSCRQRFESGQVSNYTTCFLEHGNMLTSTDNDPEQFDDLNDGNEF